MHKSHNWLAKFYTCCCHNTSGMMLLLLLLLPLCCQRQRGTLRRTCMRRGVFGSVLLSPRLLERHLQICLGKCVSGQHPPQRFRQLLRQVLQPRPHVQACLRHNDVRPAGRICLGAQLAQLAYLPEERHAIGPIERGDLAAACGVEDSLPAHVAQWAAARHDREEQASQREDVSAGIARVRVLPDDLWCHPIHGSTQTRHMFREKPAQAKVQQLGVGLGSTQIDDNIGILDITMDDLRMLCMQKAECAEYAIC
mmetsp:Transcript_124250/g.322783  ORF Transcript_124250/g.322783 Transcript_124250/m.322783 type:complete len:253 (-) Transcript_124250:971-1729(-)